MESLKNAANLRRPGREKNMRFTPCEEYWANLYFFSFFFLFSLSVGVFLSFFFFFLVSLSQSQFFFLFSFLYVAVFLFSFLSPSLFSNHIQPPIVWRRESQKKRKTILKYNRIKKRGERKIRRVSVCHVHDMNEEKRADHIFYLVWKKLCFLGKKKRKKLFQTSFEFLLALKIMIRKDDQPTNVRLLACLAGFSAKPF